MLTLETRRCTWVALLAAVAAGFWFGGAADAVPIAGFEVSPHFGEQVRTYAFEPDVRVHINAPAVNAFAPKKPTRLVIYALPNGNTIDQTVGCRMVEGLDWHYDIQHIGAQTRYLRAAIPDANIVTAYVEAGGRSWPTWRRTHADSGALIAKLIDSLRSQFAPSKVTVELAAHSGGGSLIFGFLNHVEVIPGWVGRILFLDANYGYSDEERHGDKLIAWLRASPEHYLGVVAYDDRNVRFNGKLIVGPTGGTYRKTGKMLDRLLKDMPLVEKGTASYERLRSVDGQVDVVRLHNPQNKILHTVLVEKNGFIHGLTFGAPHDGKVAVFFGARAYEEWIQPAPAPQPPATTARDTSERQGGGR